MAITTLPFYVVGLFPKENLEFAESITPEENESLKKAFEKYDCFEKVGEMIDCVEAMNGSLGKKMRVVLEGNKARLAGLSPEATAYSKKIVHFVTRLLTCVTLNKEICFKKAEELHAEFKTLSAADQAALRKNNPDVHF